MAVVCRRLANGVSGGSVPETEIQQFDLPVSGAEWATSFWRNKTAACLVG
ncbi:MAG: hypothetical protein NZ602_05565 [Thermoguttaceae bacterium]|nr:hypothetical protein [Thermoguttaceae bacterium]MDW8038017.1 hypothetical protein [Thermoguttaceae bacterium]